MEGVMQNKIEKDTKNKGRKKKKVHDKNLREKKRIGGLERMGERKLRVWGGSLGESVQKPNS